MLTYDMADAAIQQIADALAPFDKQSQAAKIDVVRENSAAIKIQIIDSQFVGLTKVERSQRVWPFLRLLGSEIQDEISALVLLSPAEGQVPWASQVAPESSRVMQ